MARIKNTQLQKTIGTIIGWSPITMVALEKFDPATYPTAFSSDFTTTLAGHKLRNFKTAMGNGLRVEHAMYDMAYSGNTSHKNVGLLVLVLLVIETNGDNWPNVMAQAASAFDDPGLFFDAIAQLKRRSLMVDTVQAGLIKYAAALAGVPITPAAPASEQVVDIPEEDTRSEEYWRRRMLKDPEGRHWLVQAKFRHEECPKKWYFLLEPIENDGSSKIDKNKWPLGLIIEEEESVYNRYIRDPDTLFPKSRLCDGNMLQRAWAHHELNIKYKETVAIKQEYVEKASNARKILEEAGAVVAEADAELARLTSAMAKV